MKKRRIIDGTLRGLLGLGILASANAFAAESRVALTGHVSNQIHSATAIGRVSASETIPLQLVVRIDEDLLQRTLNDLYANSTRGHRHFLSADEFAQLFGLADKRAQLQTFAQAHGLTVDANDPPGSMIVHVSGPARAVEDAFQVQLRDYQKSNGRRFHAIETDPLIPTTLAPHLGAVLGLSNGMEPARPHFRAYPIAQRGAAVARQAASAGAAAVITGGTGPGGTLAPADIKTIYGLNSTSQDGTGQTLALFELDGYTPADITHFESFFGLHAPTVTYVPVDGRSNVPGAGSTEVTLDIELAIALAPGLSRILVYGAPNPNGIFDMYDKIATDNLAKIVSTSWGLDETDSGSSFVHSESAIFQRMAAQGQTIYAASGDCGSYDQQDTNGDCVTTNGFRVDDPASQPYVTGVGGTSLSGTVGVPSETTWNDFTLHNIGGGGGVSGIWALSQTQAPYQIGLAGTASQSNRNVPDVALNADPYASPYAVYQAAAGGWLAIGGTSAGAPLWAAVTALIDQARASAGEGPLGFANPVLYALPESANFNDVTTGNNGVSGHYNAGTGYDNATGLGSFKGGALLASAGSATAFVPPTAAPAPLSNVYAYPNPWDARNPKDSAKHITFVNLTDDATVKIFTLAGFWIKTLPPVQGGQTAWDLTNDSGQEAASGLYLYLVNGAGAKVTGKIALIR